MNTDLMAEMASRLPDGVEYRSTVRWVEHYHSAPTGGLPEKCSVSEDKTMTFDLDAPNLGGRVVESFHGPFTPVFMELRWLQNGSRYVEFIDFAWERGRVMWFNDELEHKSDLENPRPLTLGDTELFAVAQQAVRACEAVAHWSES